MVKTRKKLTEGQELAKRVIALYKTEANTHFKVTWHFFKEQGAPRVNVYSKIKKFKDSENITFKKPARHPVKL